MRVFLPNNDKFTPDREAEHLSAQAQSPTTIDSSVEGFPAKRTLAEVTVGQHKQSVQEGSQSRQLPIHTC